MGSVERGAGNRIAFNTGDGVTVFDDYESFDVEVGATIRGNSIFGNGGLGINLKRNSEPNNSVTPNDENDVDAGPNLLQNFPILSSVVTSSGQTTVSGTLQSNPRDAYILDFYRNAQADPSGYGEGEIYVGSTNVQTDDNGNASFRFTAKGDFIGQFFTATATSKFLGTTSEFSAARRALPSLILSITPHAFSETAGKGAAQATLTRFGPTTQELTVYLLSNDTGEVRVRTIARIPAGAASITFPVDAVDDDVPDGPQRVALSAKATGFAPARAVVTVLDNEAQLTLSITPDTLREDAGAAMATLTRNTFSNTPLRVNLDSSDPAKVRVPASVVIPAGQSSVTFAVGVLDNNVADGSQRVALSAKANSFAYGRAVVTITDDETSAAPRAATSSVSSVRLSTVSASGQRVTLSFSGALNVDAANVDAADAARYSVEVKGQAAEVSSVAAKNSSIVLGLPAGALPAGAEVQVSWSGLRDAQGRPIADGAATATAR